MTEKNTHNDTTTIVEQAWKSLFEEHGVDRGRADIHVKTVLGCPQIRYNAPDKEELRDIVDQKLDEVPFEADLSEESSPGEVREQLIDILDKAIEGQIGGPLSAPRPIAQSGMPPIDDGDDALVPPSGPSGPTPKGGQPMIMAGRPSAGVDNESDLSEAERELVELLDDLIKEYDLDIDEIRVAVEFIAQREGIDQE